MKYTPQQLQQLKTMTKAEKAKIRCPKCSDYFHEEAQCPNPGRLCYNCFDYGHESTECTKPPNPKSKTKTKKGIDLDILYNKDKFNENEIFLIDSACNSHIVNDKNLLLDYIEFGNSELIKTADKTADGFHSLGYGFLPILLSCNKTKTVINLKNVHYVPNCDNSIISVSALNSQFKTSLVLYPRAGHLLCRKLKRKIANIEQSNGIYRLRGQVFKQDCPDACVLELVLLNV